MSRLISGTFEKPQLGKLEIVHRDEQIVIGTFDNYLIAHWLREAGLPAAARWTRALNELHAALPDRKLGTLTYLAKDCQVPLPQGVQSQAAEAIARARDWLAATASVYEGEGFWSATMRSHVVSIHAEAKTNVPYTITPNVEAAAAWLVAAMNDTTPVRAAALTRAVEDMVRELPAIISQRR